MCRYIYNYIYVKLYIYHIYILYYEAQDQRFVYPGFDIQHSTIFNHGHCESRVSACHVNTYMLQAIDTWPSGFNTSKNK
jgi:hypothetical protein